MTIPWPATVRKATEADEPALFDLLMELYKDNGVGIAPRPQDVREAIRAGTREQAGILIGVIDGPDGTLIGSICIVPATWWYSSVSWYLAERWLFVLPEWRKGRSLHDDLFQYARCYQQLCETATGMSWPLVTSVTSFKRLAAKMRLWRRYGRLVGGIYVIESNAGAVVETAKSEAA